MAFAPVARAQTLGTALVKSGITLNGTLTGSAELMTATSVTLNSGGSLSGNLYVPGTPTITKNGSPTYGGAQVGSGSTTPTGYQITLNSGSSLGHIVTQTNAIALAAVAAPPSPTGTRSVSLNSSSGAAAAIGAFSTLENLTLNSNVGQISVPAGTYGNFTANSGSGFTLGVAGATQPAVYNFQQLTLNSGTTLTVVGPVTITLPQGLTLNSSMGSSSNPAWLHIQISSGGVTLNSNVSLYGSVLAPSGAVTINSGGLLEGALSCNQLTINSNGTLKALSAVVADSPTVSISTPAADTVVVAPGSFSLQANAADGTGTITSVAYYSGANLIGSATSAPYQVAWSSVPAGTYSLTAVATNNFGNSTTSSPITVVVATVPTAPTVSGVASGNGQATVSFSAPSSNGGAPITSYTVTSHPGGFTATGASSPITVSGLADGTAYTFTVTATNAAGSSPASALSGSATPTGIASAPSIASVTTGNGTATVTITPPSNTGGLALSYTVTSYPGGITATGTGTTLSLTGLTDGVSYTFSVTATNADGTSTASAASSSVVPTSTPGAPTVTGVMAGGGQAVVAFTPPSNTGGLPITAYTVTSSPGGFTATGTISPITVSGLTNGVSYTFSVTATNADGAGAASAASIASTPSAPPSAPSVTTVTPGNGQATVAFTAPANTGGLPINSYTVISSPGGATATGSGSPITVMGLTEGVSYTFSVTANNADGASAASASSAAVVPSAIPSSASIASVVTSDGQATVTITPPAITGGLPLTYTVSSIPGGITTTGTGPTLTLSGLTDGVPYAFTVTASNADGSSAVSAASTPVTPTAPPSAPTVTSVTTGNGSAVVAFAAPSNTGGLAITSYTVTSSPAGLTATGTSSPITVPGLTNGVSYTFAVTATNADGAGAASTSSSAITPTAPPSAPVVTSVTPGDGQATVVFTPPTNTGGLPIASYTVTSSPGGFTATGATTPVTVTGLMDGISYSFSVTANNADGASVASASSATVVPTGPPTAPSIASESISDGQATFTITPPADTGGLPLTYTVTSIPGGITATGTGPTFTINGLTDGVAYAFTVIASNADGSSTASTPSTPATPTAPPSAPTVTSVTTGNGLASVAFTAPSSAGGLPILSYTVTSSPAGVSAAGTSSPIVISGLTNGTAYTFSVTAANADGAGAASAASVSVIPSSPPGAPTVTAVTTGDGQVTVDFTAPTNTGGLPITSYTVTATLNGQSVPSATASGTSSPIIVTGLTNGLLYSVAVTATNSGGTGPAGTPITVYAGNVPCTPVITSVASGVASAVITLDPTTCDGGYIIHSYSVTASPALPGPGTFVTVQLPITVTNLSPGVTYTFTVTASNFIGQSAASAPSAPVTIPYVPPIIVQQDNQEGALIDAVTGNLISPFDESETDPVSGAVTLAAPATQAPLAIFSGYLLTLDPQDGLYTSFFGTTVDITSGTEYDGYGNALDVIDVTQAYFVTTVGTVVPLTQPSEQLDPVTLQVINMDPYTVEATPVEYSVANGPPQA